MSLSVQVFKGDVTIDRYSAWLGQFTAEHQPIIETLVSHFRYYTSSDVFRLVEDLWQRLSDEYEIDPKEAWFAPCGYVAKSGDSVAYFFRRQNDLPESSFLRVSDLSVARLEARKTVVFLDDFIGTGQQGLQIVASVVESLITVRSDAQFIFAALIGYDNGIRRLESRSAAKVCVVERFTEEDLPFSTSSAVFPDEPYRNRAEAVVREYCARLKPKSPLGYGETQGLVGFFFGTPNNTLPIFWSKAEGWHSLLPHGESFRDPHRIIEVPPGHDATGAMYAAKINQDSPDISKEATAALYECFQTLGNMQIAAQSTRHAGLGGKAVVSLVQAIQAIQEDKHEGKPVTTALLFPSGDLIDSLVRHLYVGFEPAPTLEDIDQLRAATRLADGFTGAILVSPDGSVLGALAYPSEREVKDLLLPRRYHLASHTSALAGGLLLLFLGGGRVSLIDRGIRLMSRRFAQWHTQGAPRNTDMLEAEHGLSPGTLASVLAISFLLSDQGRGALFTLGDDTGVMAYCGKQAPSSYKWQNLSVNERHREVVTILAQQDGATVLAADGSLVTSMAMLQPPAETSGEEEVGKGARHNTASKISASTGALGVAVSEDGNITLYSKGRRVFRIMG